MPATGASTSAGMAKGVMSPGRRNSCAATRTGNFRWDSPDTVDLLKEKEHTPGTVIGYYYDEEYPFLMEREFEIVREMKPELKDQLI